MTRSDLLQFMRNFRHVVQASVSDAGAAQAAVVGVAVTDALELVFDTVDTNRKAQNIRRHPKVAFVIGGWDGTGERTVQYEGVADEPSGAELTRLKEIYFRRFSDGRQRESWPGLIYVRVRPTWIRYSDFEQDPPEIVVFDRFDSNPS